MNTTDKTTFGFIVTDVTRLMRKHFDRRALRFNLTRAQWRALKRLHHEQGISQSDLAEFLEMEPIAVGRVIDRLQKAGFVERRADPADRRAWRLYLMPGAHDVLEEMETIASDLYRQAQRGIPAAELKTMISVLARMKDNLSALDDAEDR